MYGLIYNMMKKEQKSLSDLLKGFIALSVVFITLQSVLLGYAEKYNKLNGDNKYNKSIIGFGCGMFAVTFIFIYISYKTYYSG